MVLFKQGRQTSLIATFAERKLIKVKDMGSEILTALVALFCSTVSSMVTFFLTRRKYNTEVDSQQIENMNKSFDAYKRMMEATVEEQNKKIESLQKENETLRNQIQQLNTQMINFLMGKNLSDVKDGLLPLTQMIKAETK